MLFPIALRICMGTLPRIYIKIYAGEFEGGGLEGAYFDLILNIGPYLFHG
jgi:hypothetical protein